MHVYFRNFILSVVALVALTGCLDGEINITASSGFFNAEGTLTLTAEVTSNDRKAPKVKRVVFRQGDEVIGVDKKAPFAIGVPVTAELNGFHLYTATAYDAFGNNITSGPARVFVSIGDKFFGTAPDVQADYDNMPDFFDQITPGNAGKWGSVEGTRDEMNWTNLDTAYNFARANGMRFKHHTLIWGQQQPGWLADLTPEEQLAEIEEWYAAVAERYPNLEMIDVVNEPLHAPPAYAAALGGAGETGWDWVIKSFELAREHFPNTQLILNDYQILHLEQFTADYLVIINLLKDRGLIDAIGVQGHFLEQTSGSMVLTNLNSLAATGLPIYVTEFDLHIANDARQANKMRELFSVFWDHPSVVGVTHWGYLQGAVWQANAYLIRSDGTYRPSLDWLLCYMAGGGDSCTVPVYTPPGWQGDEFGVTLEAEQYDGGEGVVALGDVVAFTDDGDWISFSSVDFQTAWNTLWVTYAKGNTEVGSISIHLDSLENAPVATVTLEPTAGWGSFETIEVPWTQLSETRDVYVRFNDVGGVANIDDIRIGRPIPTSNENLVVDGGFEGATIAGGWGAFGNSSVFALTTDPVFSGNQSLQITGRTGTGGYAAYNLTGSVEAGVSYAVSAQVYQAGAAADTVRLVAKVGCTSGDSYNWLENDTAVAPNTWTELANTMTIPEACVITEVQIYLEGTAAATTVYIDEVKVVPPAAPDDGNLVTDSSFEGPVVPAGWQTWFTGGTVLQLSNAKAFAGSKSLLASNRVANSYPSYVLTTLVEPGVTYSFSAYALHTGAAPDTVAMTTKLACSGQSDVYTLLQSVNMAPDTWTQLSGIQQIPADCSVTEARVYFEGTTPGVDVYLDKVEIFPPAANLFPNGGFEAGVTGWSSWNSSVLSASTAQVYAGSQSLLATARPDTNQFAVSPNIGGALIAGTSYSVSAQVYQAGAGADLVRMVAKLRCGTTDSFHWLHEHTSVPANTWTQLSQNALAIPADCDITEVLIFFEGTIPGVDVYVDEVTVLPL